MNIRHRNLLALALAGALASPIALAQGNGTQKNTPPTTGTTVGDAVRSEGPVRDEENTTKTLAQTANETEAAPQQTTTSNDAGGMDDATTSNDAVDAAQATTTTSNDAATAQSATGTSNDAADITRNDATDAAKQEATPPPPRDAKGRMVKNPTNTQEADREKTPPVPPVQSQGVDNAAAHASVTQRALFGRLDTDGDGQISAAESAVDAEFNAGFQAMDSNDDGLVTGDEYQVSARTDLGSGQAQGGVNAATHSTASVRDAVGRLDTNADGSISASEAQADASFNASFAAADANSDGMVSSAEYQAWVKAQRK